MPARDTAISDVRFCTTGNPASLMRAITVLEEGLELNIVMGIWSCSSLSDSFRVPLGDNFCVSLGGISLGGSMFADSKLEGTVLIDSAVMVE